MIKTTGIALISAISSVALLTGAAVGETQTENIDFEQRTYLYINATDDVIARSLPEGWQATPIPQGPLAGTDAILILIDRRLATDAGGKALATDPILNAVFVVPAQLQGGENAGFVIVGGYTADKANAPGAYGNYEPADIRSQRLQRVSATGSMVEESWHVSSDDGDRIDLVLAYEEAVPAPAIFDQKVISGADPEFYRMYRGSQLVDVLENSAAGIDRVEEMQLSGTGGLAGDFLTDAQIIAVARFPYYTRDTFVAED